jgi:hypothetical protein
VFTSSIVSLLWWQCWVLSWDQLWLSAIFSISILAFPRVRDKNDPSVVASRYSWAF